MPMALEQPDEIIKGYLRMYEIRRTLEFLKLDKTLLVAV